MPQVEPVGGKHPIRIKGVVVALLSLPVIALVVGVTLFVKTPSPAQAVAQAEKLNAEARYSDAMSVLKRSQWRAWSKADKALMLSLLAATSTNRNQLDEALQYYDEMSDLGVLNYSMTLSAGETAERAGKKEVAIRYYEKALQILETMPKDDPMNKADKRRLTNAVAALKK